eukprot:scaffold3111_cov263-Chaetoceros_neogracile.AAC.11
MITTVLPIVILSATASAFGIIDPSTMHSIHDATQHITSAIHDGGHVAFSNGIQHASSNIIADENAIASTALNAFNPLEAYAQQLVKHPLITKMMTGATLAVCGDAIAQSQNDDEYDKRRAASFAGFDFIYRAVQHYSFPAIVQHCQGQYIASILATIPGLQALVQSQLGENAQSYFGAMEQTLASQLVIVPFFYYPVFYTVTAFVQGLDRDAAIQRAKDTFIPLMQRNLLFWIPVQFIQFGYVDENLQIPFLSVAGLAWTFIISVFAGKATAAAKSSSLENAVEVEFEVEDEDEKLMVVMDMENKSLLSEMTKGQLNATFTGTL